MKEKMTFVAIDADNVGESIGNAVLSDDSKELSSLSGKINNGSQIFSQWAEYNGGSVISSGSDEAVVEVPVNALEELEKLKDKYLEETGFSVSIGIGEKISDAAKALIYAKINGKNTIIDYSPEIEETIKQSISESSEIEDGTYDETTELSEEDSDTKTIEVPEEELDGDYGSEEMAEGQPDHELEMGEEEEFVHDAKENREDEADDDIVEADEENNDKEDNDEDLDGIADEKESHGPLDESDDLDNDGDIEHEEAMSDEEYYSDQKDYEDEYLEDDELAASIQDEMLEQEAAEEGEEELNPEDFAAEEGEEELNPEDFAAEEGGEEMLEQEAAEEGEEELNPEDFAAEEGEEELNPEDFAVEEGEEEAVEEGDEELNPEDFAAEAAEDEILEEGGEESEKGEGGLSIEMQSLKEVIYDSLQVFKQNKEQLIEISQQNPDLYQSLIFTLQSMIEMAKEMGFGDIASEISEEDAAAEEGEEELNPEDFAAEEGEEELNPEDFAKNEMFNKIIFKMRKIVDYIKLNKKEEKKEENPIKLKNKKNAQIKIKSKSKAKKKSSGNDGSFCAKSHKKMRRSGKDCRSNEDKDSPLCSARKKFNCRGKNEEKGPAVQKSEKLKNFLEKKRKK
jgi:hypothetical protein